jgi:hypothetical protein
MSPQMSRQQSIENYIYFYDQIKKELGGSNIFLNITRVIILDEFYDRNLINKSFHTERLKECIAEDKEEELKDLYHSMIVAGTLMTFIFIFYLPSDNYYLFRIMYYIYLAVIYYIAFLFYKNLN